MTRWLEELWQDSHYAVRTFRRNPGFTITTLLILALGIAATTVMFAIINSVLLRPLPFPNPDRLVTLHGFTSGFGEFWGFSQPDYFDTKNASRSLSTAEWTYGGGTISEPGEPEYVDGRQISADLFPTLGISPVYGRAFKPREDRPGAPPVAIISYSLWQRRFAADPSAVGKTFVFDGKPYLLAGVAPLGFELSGDADVFTPIGQSTDPRLQNRQAHFIHAIARLNDASTLAQAQAELIVIASHLAKQYPKSNLGLTMRARPLLEDLVVDVRGTLWLLLAAVALVLLIACVNVASLMLTRALTRERELAMRVALGASRTRLTRQCITESAVLGIGGGLLGVLLAALGIHPFLMFWPGSLPRAAEIHLDWRVLSFGIALSLASGLLFGLMPGLRVPLRCLDAALRGGSRTIASGSRHLHSPFVVSEIALAFVLLICAGMLGHTLLHLSALNPGLNPRHLLTARFALSPAALSDPAHIRAAWQDVLDRTRHLPGVEFAALADIVPMREGENSLSYRTTPAPVPQDQEPIALASSVTPDYLNVMGIPLREGRFLSETDRAGSTPVVVVDENLAQHAFGRKNVVGERLWISAMGTSPVQIVGVAGHVRHWGLAGDDVSRVRDQIYYPFAQVPAPLLHFFSTVMSITIRTRTPPLELAEPLRRELRGAAGDQALYEVRTMDQLMSASLARQRFLLFLFGIFAGLALLLASIGLYAVLAYLTGQRVPEIGLRMAVGANMGDVLRMILWQSSKMVLIGVAAGIFAALAAGRLLERLVQGMQPVSAGTFAIVIPLLTVAALIASFIPARRASTIDPVAALRQD